MYCFLFFVLFYIFFPWVNSEASKIYFTNYPREIRLLQLDLEMIEKEKNVWEQMFGTDLVDEASAKTWDIQHYDKEGTSVPKTDTNAPKHGKEDEKNEPHVGVM